MLLPEGIDHLGDCPSTLHEAINTGLRILGYEQLTKEEQPPKRIWLNAEKLDEHFKWVEAEREKKYGSGKSEADSEDEPEAEENAVELISRG